jgi:hypothetical protein
MVSISVSTQALAKEEQILFYPEEGELNFHVFVQIPVSAKLAGLVLRHWVVALTRAVVVIRTYSWDEIRV